MRIPTSVPVPTEVDRVSEKTYSNDSYDGMSVHDLLGEAFNNEFMWSIESAIRRAVIHEASVGKCHINTFYMKLNENAVDGEYYLVPEEKL